MKKPDIWDGIALTGAGLLGGGVWAKWGPAVACILWGSLLLLLAVTHAAHSKVKRVEE